MYRVGLVLMLVIPPGLCAITLAGDDKPAMRETLVLQEAIKDAIKQAEPSIACVLVSRSNDYSKLYHDSPPADSPGKLGAFDASRRERDPAPFFGGGRRRGFRGGADDRLSKALEEDRKYDLSLADAVPEAFGSGVVIDGQELLILTNHHVVRDATKIYVRLPGGKGSYADIHASDPRSDLAVLRLIDTSLRPLKAIRFGDGASVEKGQFILTLTHPYAAGFKDGGPSASWGMISNIQKRAAPWPWEDPDEVLRRTQQPFFYHKTLLQTDARLNLGCSGGALLNLGGEMIGLTTARAAATGSESSGGFAVPMDAAMKRIIDKLREGVEVEYGFLGVGSPPEAVGQSARDIAANEGVLVNPLPGSPAQKAGLHSPELIKSINGIPLREYDDLYLIVCSLLAGSEARLAVRGREQLVPVTLTKSYVRGTIIASKRPAAVRGLRVDYTSVLYILQQLEPRQRFNIPEIHPGVFVSEILPNSPADLERQKLHLRLNDVVTHLIVKGTEVPVNTPAEFYREAAKVGAGEPLELKLLNTNWQRNVPTVIIPGNALRDMQ